MLKQTESLNGKIIKFDDIAKKVLPSQSRKISCPRCGGPISHYNILRNNCCESCKRDMATSMIEKDQPNPRWVSVIKKTAG